MIELSNIHIEYNRVILEKEDIQIPESQFTLIMGKSGSGKSALLYRIGLISKENDGTYLWNKESVSVLSDSKKAQIRKYQIGYVFQDYNLYDHLNIYDHLEHYTKIAGQEMSNQYAVELLKKVRLHISLEQNIHTLSGGEKQRLAVACALAKKPTLIILDEPTSFLDDENEMLLFQIFRDLTHDGITVVCASHSLKAKEYADQIYIIEDKRLNLLKGSSIDKNVPVNLSEKAPFVLHYIKKFMTRYKYLQVFMVVVMILGLFSFLYVKEKNYQSQLIINKEIADSIDNEMLIENVSEKQLNKMKSLDYIKSIYPYYQFQIVVNQKPISIYPLFEENKIDNIVEFNYTLKSRRSFYIDSQTVENNPSIFNKGKYIDQVQLYTGTHFMDLSIREDVSGVLKKGISTGFTQSLVYGYLNYDHMVQILNDYHIDLKINSYVVFTKDIYTYKQLCDYLKQENIQFNDNFQATDNLLLLINQAQNIGDFQDYWLFIILVFILSLLTYHYFSMRKKEFAIVYANGMTKLEIIKMVTIESLLRICCMVSVALAGITLLKERAIFQQEIFSYCIDIFILSTIIFIIPVLLQSLLLSRLNCEKVIRE